MASRSAFSDSSTHAAAAAIAVLVFILDLWAPAAGIAMLYVLVVLLGLRSGWTHYPVASALATGVLVWVAWLLKPGGPAGAAIVEATLVTGLCVSSTFMTARFARLQLESARHLRQLTDLKEALDHAAIVATTDVTGRITDVNQKFCEISGYSRGELIGQDHRIINSGGHPKAFIRDLWQTIARGGVWRGEIRNRAKGGHFYWVETTIVPFLTAEGKPQQYIAIRADVTARKVAEEQLAQQAALAQVGQLAAVVAHEVRNPLAGIKGAIQILLSRRLPGDGEISVMRDIVERIDALSELINDLMVFARPRPPLLGRVDLPQIVREALTMVRRDPPGVVVEMTPGDALPLTCDGNLLRAAVLNLLLNAMQAAGASGRVTVTVSRGPDHAIIDVRDTGPGVPVDLRRQIFEPFFTTKARGGGLGLPTARRTAELHGGTLTLECPEGGGTIFSLRLPLQPVPLPSAAATTVG